ncbi:MAG: response regulator [Blastocatellia bacterium]
MNVMVIEDDPINLKLVCVVLNAEGHNVMSAENRFEAIRTTRPDVLLLDLALPGMSGLEMVRLLKQKEETRDIPIVAVTAYPDRWPRDTVLAQGCDAYLIKPVDIRRLVGQLSSAVSR